MKKLNFKPLFLLSSKHAQTILGSFRLPGSPPPSISSKVEIEEGDFLSCEVSTPLDWKPTDSTLVLVHGLGGSHTSGYMIRLARKLYLKGHRIIRVNLRGCGSGKGLSKLPYHAGDSSDILKVLKKNKDEFPESPITLIGFSLGGNIVLKLAEELGTKASHLIKSTIAICPPLDLKETVEIIEEKKHKIYHSYYLKKIAEQSLCWTRLKTKTLYEFDNKITAPLRGYADALDYYQKCSCLRFLPHIRHSTHILFAEDDPFISLNRLQDLPFHDSLHIWATKHGGHLGFIGQTTKKHNSHWIDQLLRIGSTMISYRTFFLTLTNSNCVNLSY